MMTAGPEKPTNVIFFKLMLCTLGHPFVIGKK